MKKKIKQELFDNARTLLPMLDKYFIACYTNLFVII